MPDLATWGIAAAFAGSLVSFFSPCTLPLAPGYLSVVTGGAINDSLNRLKAFWLSLCFVLVVMGVMVITGQMTRFASWMLSAFPVLGQLG